MARHPLTALLAALPLSSLLLGGCFIQTPTVTSVPTTAAVGQLQLVVPQPEAVARGPAVPTVPWNKARLTIAPVNGSAPTVSDP